MRVGVDKSAQVRHDYRMTEEDEIHLTLRPMCLTDLDALVEWFWNAEDVALFDRQMPVPVNATVLRESWREALEFSDPPRAYWYVACDSAGVPVGFGGLQGINYIHGDGVMPMFVARHMRRKGMAKSISVAMIELAFNTLRLHRLTTFFRSDNEGSRRALEAVGWQVEGCLREAWFADGVRRDVIQVGLLREEWMAQRAEVRAQLGGPGRVRLHGHGER